MFVGGVVGCSCVWLSCSCCDVLFVGWLFVRVCAWLSRLFAWLIVCFLGSSVVCLVVCCDCVGTCWLVGWLVGWLRVWWS